MRKKGIRSLLGLRAFIGGPIYGNWLGAVGEHWRQPQKSTIKEKSTDRSWASHPRTVIFKVDGSDVWRLALQLARLMASQLTTFQLQLAGPFAKNRVQKLAPWYFLELIFV